MPQAQHIPELKSTPSPSTGIIFSENFHCCISFRMAGAEAVKVIVRCRPMNAREKGLNCQCVVDMDNKVGQCSIRNPTDKKAPPKSFTFDGAYFTDSTTEQIYADIGYPLVEVSKSSC